MNGLKILAKKYNLEYTKTHNKIEIKPIFNFTERVDIGVLLLLFVPIAFLIYIFKEINDFDFMIFLLIGICIFISIFALLSILKTKFDKVTVRNNQIIFSNSLIRRKITITNESKFELESNDIELKIRYTTERTTIIDLSITHDNKKYRFLDFSSETINSTELVELGNLIITEIKTACNTGYN